QLIIVMVMVITLFALPGTALAQTGNPPPPTPAPQDYKITSGDKVITGGDFRLKTGEAIDGNLLVFGGNASLEEGSAVFGTVTIFGGNVNIGGYVDEDVILFGGTMNVTGEIKNDINAMGGAVNLQKDSKVGGDVNGLGVSINQDESAQIGGVVNTEDASNMHLNIPQIGSNVSWQNNNNNPASSVLSALVQALLMGALAAIALLALPKPMNRLSGTLRTQPGMSALVGGLSVVAIPLLIGVLVFAMITIILIPVSIMALILLGLAMAVGLLAGWITLGYELGNLFVKATNLTWAAPITAGVGTFAITLFSRMLDLVPCVGPAVSALAYLFGFGIVLVTLFTSKTPTSRKIVPVGTIPPAFPTAPAAAPEPVAPATSAPESPIDTPPAPPVQ
ncbi:MAG: hypothetical protein HGA86_02250, partial [Anaerolineaceae bacterium]|nr:hypothetical protein [Anaerolineaceae bacterium]